MSLTKSFPNDDHKTQQADDQPRHRLAGDWLLIDLLPLLLYLLLLGTNMGTTRVPRDELFEVQVVACVFSKDLFSFVYLKKKNNWEILNTT